MEGDYSGTRPFVDWGGGGGGGVRERDQIGGRVAQQQWKVIQPFVDGGRVSGLSCILASRVVISWSGTSHQLSSW